MGAPITAYDRISDYEIRVHSNIYEPDFVVVVDDTLLHSVDVTAGLNTKGGVLINTEKGRDEIMPLLKGYEGAVYTINARKVCMETLGKYFPNMPMLSALARISGIMEKDVFFMEMEASLKHKFEKKPEVFAGNMKALQMAFDAVELISGPADGKKVNMSDRRVA
jgi:pyruvate ferredoxin oxidoreductase gamma subunit